MNPTPKQHQGLVHWFRRAAAASDITPNPHALAPVAPSQFSPALRTRLLVLQPTPFCNIDCRYCYLPDRQNTARMALPTLRLAAQRLVDDGLLGTELTVVWHAGEPMTLPPSYYEDAIGEVNAVMEAHADVAHAMQTNATLIDGAWCGLIRRHQIRIGVSVDGPAALHDAQRVTRQGRGTHQRVMHGLAQLREAEIPFHAIAVLSAATLQQPQAFFDFFEQLGVTELCCNFDEAEGAHTASSLAGHEAAHAQFLSQLLAHLARPGNRLRVRELAAARQLLAQPLPQVRWQGQGQERHWPENWQVLPMAMVNVAHDGRFSTFSPELMGQPAPEFNHFYFGDVADGGYLQALRHPAFLRAWQRIVQGVDACEARCAYFAHCGGGAPANKHYELGDMAGTETLYCRTMLQRPFEAVLQHVEALIAQQREALSASRAPSLPLSQPAPLEQGVS